MDNNNEALANTLNELVRINYDRVYGYEKAAEEAAKAAFDLKAIFNQYADTSRGYITHWQQLIRSLGGEPAVDSTIRGKVYRVWMDFRATLTGNDRENILKSCVFGEKAAIDAYEDALATDAHLPDTVRQEIARQKSNLQDAHKSIELYVSAHEKVG